MSGLYLTKAPTGASILPGDIGAFKPEWWSTDIIRYRRSNLLVTEHTKKISFVGRAGDRIRIPRIGRLGVRPLVPGNPVQLQARSEVQWSMLIDRYMESSFAIQDLTNIQANQNLRAEYTSEAGRALAEDLENFTLGMRAAVIGANASSNPSPSTSPIGYADFLAAMLILDKRRVPSENRFAIISPSQKASLLTGTSNILINREFGQLADIRKGYIGEILEISIYVSNHMLLNSTTGYTNGDSGAPEPTPGMAGSPYYPTQWQDEFITYTPTALTANYYGAIIGHPEWCALAIQKVPTVDADWNTDYQEYHVVQAQAYGAKLYRTDHAVVLQTDDDNLV